MAHYEFNKKTYHAITLRINRNTDADIIEKLESEKSVNAYLLKLIRKDMYMQTCSDYEVIEVVNGVNHVVGRFPRYADAVEFLQAFVYQFPTGNPVKIVRRYEATLSNGTKVICGETIENESKEQEEKENA